MVEDEPHPGAVAPRPVKVAFDTSVVIAWHRGSQDSQSELAALNEILRMKQADSASRWQFLYIDAVRREFSGLMLDHLAREESEVADLLASFDPPVMLSRLPTVLPFVISGPAREQAEKFFLARSVSKKDATVLADAVFLGCSVCVTLDGRLRNNTHAVKEALHVHGLRIVTTVELLAMMRDKAA